MDILLIALLTLLNGAFAMSELALTASRKVRLSALAEAGDKGASLARRLSAVVYPNGFKPLACPPGWLTSQPLRWW